MHWLEIGSGARGIRLAALLVAILLLSLRIGYTQFRGPRTEATLAQAVVGRQVAAGEGFTTPVRYPQTLAVLRAHGQKPDFERAWPELHQAPLYPAAIGGALSVMPARIRHALFQSAPKGIDGFRADYLLLGLNVVLLWIAAVLTWWLGRKLFDTNVGFLAALGLLLGSTIWAQTVAVTGLPLMMVLLLGLAHFLVRGDGAATAGRPLRLWFFGAGVTCGLMCLCDYTACLVVVPVLVYAGLRCRGGARWAAIFGVAIGFLLVVYPWLSRNVGLTDNPFGLAGQGIALKAGDPTAEPEAVRNTLSAESPVILLNKVGNKGLTALQTALASQVWSGGLLFTALFAVSLLYRFRSALADRMRWVLLAILVVLIVSFAFLDSGEGERFPAFYAVPIVMVFGAGFFAVLVASNEKFAPFARWLAVALLGLQALPLLHDILEPRRAHFSYPPYYPAVYCGMRDDSSRRGGAAWMADVPAGAAWYSGQCVWSQPATLREFYEIGIDQPLYALVLGPKTLGRPFFGGLNRIGSDPSRLGEWAQVYTWLVTNRPLPGFPLTLAQKFTDDLYVLFDPRVVYTDRK